jgi:hypothetical protein
VAEVQALLNDHIECSKHTAADVVANAQAVLTAPRAVAGDVRRWLLAAEYAAGLMSGAAAMPPIPDSKVTDRRGRNGPLATFRNAEKR